MTAPPIEEGPAKHSFSWPLLHFCMMLTGLATALLGPVLPLLSHHWRLNDQQTGLLLLAQFIGSGSGGLTVSRHLRRSLILGLAAAALGFMSFALAPGLPLACISLLFGGWGCGQVITAGNIVAGRRGNKRGSAIALLNFTWSFGAMLSPLLAAWLTPHFALQTLLAAFASLFAIALAGILAELAGKPFDAPTTSTSPTAGESTLALVPYLYFVALLLFYGGVETCLSAWLTTYTLRYGGRTLVYSEYTALIFWASLTAGRALSSLLMLRIRELPLQRASLAITTVCTIGLATTHTGLIITLLAVFLGIGLAPFFPATFSLLMVDKPSARQAGVVLAMSGLGAALFPSLMGVVSTHSASLQRALAIPLFAAVILVFLSIFPPSRAHSTPA